MDQLETSAERLVNVGGGSTSTMSSPELEIAAGQHANSAPKVSNNPQFTIEYILSEQQDKPASEQPATPAHAHICAPPPRPPLSPGDSASSDAASMASNQLAASAKFDGPQDRQRPAMQQPQSQQPPPPNLLYFMACMLLQQQQQQQQQQLQLHQQLQHQHQQHQQQQQQQQRINLQHQFGQTRAPGEHAPSPMESLAILARLTGSGPSQLEPAKSQSSGNGSGAHRPNASKQPAGQPRMLAGRQPLGCPPLQPAAYALPLGLASTQAQPAGRHSHSHSQPNSQPLQPLALRAAFGAPLGEPNCAQAAQQFAASRAALGHLSAMSAFGAAHSCLAGPLDAQPGQAAKRPKLAEPALATRCPPGAADPTPSPLASVRLKAPPTSGSASATAQDNLKPAHSYIGLIGMCILSSADKRMVLNDIYQYILDHYPYYRNRGSGWRNSVRHNLSLNECFQKAGRAANGKGHYWTIHPANMDDFMQGDFRRRRAQRKVRRWNNMEVASDESDDDTDADADADESTRPPLPEHFKRSIEMHRRLELSYRKSAALDDSQPRLTSAHLAAAAAAAAAAVAAAQQQQQQQQQQQHRNSLAYHSKHHH